MTASPPRQKRPDKKTLAHPQMRQRSFQLCVRMDPTVRSSQQDGLAALVGVHHERAA
ncbi:hypothetical protein RUM8411_00526 [Ruegeria meonggei]|uniref:Uncharacterized protein n=1 Tax=Ruegeria meonggei TaxID=1446476 RepID=A0A1X6YBN6_9RHOB|nr:hypothetical protein RUM8411_00526 [Ruegeria meonggei]